MEPLIKALDRKNLISYYFYRGDCVKINGENLKDLSKLGRELKEVILLKVISLYLFHYLILLPIRSSERNK